MKRSRPAAILAGSVVALGLIAAAAWHWSQPQRPAAKPWRKAPRKVFLIGFDGMDPTLTRAMLAQGKLPNLARLAAEGTFSVLQTTQPSESPTAWASFATGVNPGQHDIYDFLVRDFETYAPDITMVKKEPPSFLWGLIPIRGPRIQSTRGGTSFWVHAGRDGIRSLVLTVPVTFPVESVEHSDLLAGFPAPDLRGTVGTFSYWASDLPAYEVGNTEFGGILDRLLFEDGVANTVLVGPDNPVVVEQEANLRRDRDSLSEDERSRLDQLASRRRLSTPVQVRWRDGDDSAQIVVSDRTLRLQPGGWTDWVPVVFRVNPLLSVRGMVQFHLLRADHEVQLYASPVNLDPSQPAVPISAPGAFSRELAKSIGPYRTLGWAEPTWPLNEGRLDEAAFMADCDRAFADRERIFMANLRRDDWDLFLAVIETTDRVSHMMWRFIDPRHPMHDAALAERWGDAIERTYRRCDDLVGRMRRQLPPDAVVIVMSDHGFHSFRRCVNLNSWLAQNGYLVFDGQPAGLRRLDDLFGKGKFWAGVDWSRSRAYALGLGQIYFNLKGREKQGIVSSGAEYARLQDEIIARLSPLVDPETGEPVFGGIYRRDELYHGQYLVNAPDLQAGFNDGYRVGWQDTLGGIRPTVIENNNRRWSGDHCGTAREISGGVLFINRRLSRDDPHIMDLAPTILQQLGVPLPEGLDGKPIL